MFLFSKINPFVFFVSLFVGLLITYVTTPTPDIIYQYPTPENLSQTYIDDAKVCFQYKKKKITCPKNKNQITEYPIQSKKEVE